MPAVEWNIERVLDEGLHGELPEILAKTDVDSLFQFFCNSYDADASRVEIQYYADKGLLLIKDDGEGMGTEEKLRTFYKRGGSKKKVQRKTAKGRLKIGKFSLAAALLSYLAEKYKLETVGDGSRATIEEDFRETGGGRKVPKPKVETAKPTEHGTTITLIDLKRRIDLEELTWRASRELPVTRDDFELFINGERVRPPRIDEAAVFFMDEEIKGIGKVYGEFYLSPNKIKGHGGIYVKVHDCAVGDPMAPFSLGRKTRGKVKAKPTSAIGMSQRVIGFVYADGLDPYIGFDRSGLKEDHPKVIEVHERIAAFLGTIRRYYDAAVREESRKKKLDHYMAVVENVERRFNRADKEFLPRGRCVFELSREEGKDYPVEIDTEQGKVIVYTGHSYFTGIRNPVSLEASLTAAVAFAMGRKRIEKRGLVTDSTKMDAAFLKAFSILHPQGKKLSDTLFGEKEVSAFEQPNLIEPTRLYRLEEVVDLTKLDRTTVEDMIKVGLLEEPIRKPKLVSEGITYVEGKSVREAIGQTEGHKLLVQIVRETFPDIPTEDHLEFVDDLTQTLEQDSRADEYVKNIGVLGPFYVVQNDRVELFKTYLREHGILNIKKRTYGVINDGPKYLFFFSLRVPRKDRNRSEEFFRAEMEFLEEYQRRDTGSRTRVFYLPQQNRVVGVVLSFDQALLRKGLEDYKFEKQDSIPRRAYDSEFPSLKMMQPGQSKFAVLNETPDTYRSLLLN